MRPGQKKKAAEKDSEGYFHDQKICKLVAGCCQNPCTLWFHEIFAKPWSRGHWWTDIDITLQEDSELVDLADDTTACEAVPDGLAFFLL